MQTQADTFLSLPALVEALHKDGLLSKDSYTLAKKIHRSKDEQNTHSISLVAKQNYVDARQNGKILNETRLVAWLAEKHRIETFQIDPLEIDVTAVTQIMSYAFSERHQILAVKVTRDEVWVACCEPEASSWIADVEHVSRRMVKRVLTSPTDIERYRVEFYQLATSVSRASKAHPGASSVQNLE